MAQGTETPLNSKNSTCRRINTNTKEADNGQEESKEEEDEVNDASASLVLGQRRHLRFSRGAETVLRGTAAPKSGRFHFCGQRFAAGPKSGRFSFLAVPSQRAAVEH